jgi:N-acylneuraminate cytidylyltransferase
MTSCIALVPARAGSKRVPAKNVRPLGGHPLIAYTIGAALDSGVFERVVVSTDSDDTARIARSYGADAPFLRPAEFAGDLSPDIEWVEHALKNLGRSYDAFSLLRPTSPFRQPETIRRAWELFSAAKGADSLRAVQRCREHPGKMWVIEGERMRPLLPGGPKNPPWHSTPYQALPPVYIQNASLEIAWSRVALDGHTIAGDAIVPFVTEGLEGFDINGPHEWTLAEHFVATGEGRLPRVREAKA